jgi:hypothetical protein
MHFDDIDLMELNLAAKGGGLFHLTMTGLLTNATSGAKAQIQFEWGLDLKSAVKSDKDEPEVLIGKAVAAVLDELEDEILEQLNATPTVEGPQEDARPPRSPGLGQPPDVR